MRQASSELALFCERYDKNILVFFRFTVYILEIYVYRPSDCCFKSALQMYLLRLLTYGSSSVCQTVAVRVVIIIAWVGL